MARGFLLLSVLSALSAGAQAATLPAADAALGKKVHDAYCTSCHTDSVYTRKDRHVTDMQGLLQKVDVCGHQIDVSLSKAQMNNLTKYLNDTYYKFK
ncbi:MAG: hypothetical protein HY081_12585 [Gammaproteobacteria bacterium]|nr:hypothetical protein [Gammaproteobacteria bacterium]